jgi:transposase
MLPSSATTVTAVTAVVPTGPAGTAASAQSRSIRPDPEVPGNPVRPRRRQFTAAYKLRILREADQCAVGQIGALLRREGLYSSHLTNWRHQRAQGDLTALAPQRRGRPATSSEQREVAQLRAENARLVRKLAAAETVIEVQKKLASLLGLAVHADPETPEAPEPATLARPRATNNGKRSWQSGKR